MTMDARHIDVNPGPNGHGCDLYCSWRELAPRFPEDRDCLAAFVALEAAEVLAGAKPANLVRLPNRPHLCGRNFCELWSRHGAEVLRQSRLEAAVLRETEEFLLLLFHRPDLMERRLAGRAAPAFLQRAGYSEPKRWSSALAQLRERFRDGFPHEIGVFLGYPLKDVGAFMGWTALPVTGQRMWKIFGHSRRSLRLTDHYRHLRRQMIDNLAATRQPLTLLGP